MALLATFALGGCQSITNNETTYPFTFKENSINAMPSQRVIIAHTNLGTPSRQYLSPYISKIDNLVKAKLESNGFTVVDNRRFQADWRGAVRRHGAPYNEQTGHINRRALEAVLADSLAATLEKDVADLVIFTDLIERDIVYVGRSKRVASWDGVSRPVKVRGGGGQISQDFDWSQKAKAASLLIIGYTVTGEHFFKGAGGLDVTREIDPRTGTGRFVRKRSQFTNRNHLEEGTSIALHPLVPMAGYVDHSNEQ